MACDCPPDLLEYLRRYGSWFRFNDSEYLMLPIRTNILPQRTPYANYILIAVTLILFFFQFTINPYTGQRDFRPWAYKLMLKSDDLHAVQFVGYAFLHGGFWHFFANMFFLYIFGNNVNDKLGHLQYVLFYLAGAAVSGLAHYLNSDVSTQLMGASGAVCAVTGAYLVLYPKSLITVLYWFFFIGTVELPALWFILLKLILIDNVAFLNNKASAIAYDAHLAGYAWGIGLTLFLLAVGWLPGSHFDLWAMIQRWHRRRQYRDSVAREGVDPFTGAPVQRKYVWAREVKKGPEQLEKEHRIQSLRTDIATRVSQRNMSAAVELYLELMKVDASQVLPRQYLLDIANQLASQKRHTESALAYEQFLTHYGSYEYIEQVMLMLGLIYSRYLGKPVEARKYLVQALERLSDPGQIQMCREELGRLIS